MCRSGGGGGRLERCRGGWNSVPVRNQFRRQVKLGARFGASRANFVYDGSRPGGYRTRGRNLGNPW
eukprot:2185563-Rhodomonas_salina.3